MTEAELQNALRDIVEGLIAARPYQVPEALEVFDDPLSDIADRTEGMRTIRTFDDVGMMTSDKGLVIECNDGSAFQVSIVRRA